MLFLLPCPSRGMTGQWSYEAVPSTISTPMPLAGHDCQVVMADAGTDSISTPMPLAGHDPLRWDKSCPDKLFLLPCPSRGMTHQKMGTFAVL